MDQPTADRPAAAPRIGLIVEDRDDTRRWLRQMLASAFEGIEIAEATTRAEAFRWLSTFGSDGRPAPAAPHIGLIDLGLPDGTGVDIIREIADHHPDMIPVVTTIYDDDQHLFDAIAAGARGYLLKDQHEATLVRYLHRIEEGEPPLTPSIARRMLAHFSRSPRPRAGTDAEVSSETLTAREVEVLTLMGKGLRVSEAAQLLGITSHTVAGYVKTVYRKLNISSRAEAAVEAMRRGLI